MYKMGDWLRAMRLRTLPLALSSVLLGSLLALRQGSFSAEVALWAACTTLFLQILSNLANDYGDFVKGVDGTSRVGPARAVQSGAISPRQMLRAIALFALLSFSAGLCTLYSSFESFLAPGAQVFLVLGLGAIAAALFYTLGTRPYGYRGLGDLSVFIFFGLLGVGGTYYLHTHYLSWPELLPAASVGLLATAVLNLNNLRDYEGDRRSGKRSLVVLLGPRKARVYYAALLAGALLAALLYCALRYYSPFQLTFLLALPILLDHARVVMQSERSSELDSELKKLALITLFFAISLGVGINL